MSSEPSPGPGRAAGRRVQRGPQRGAAGDAVHVEGLVLQHPQRLEQVVVRGLGQDRQHPLVGLTAGQRLRRRRQDAQLGQRADPALAVHQVVAADPELGLDLGAGVGVPGLDRAHRLLARGVQLVQQQPEGLDGAALAGLVRPLDHGHAVLGERQFPVGDAAEVRSAGSAAASRSPPGERDQQCRGRPRRGAPIPGPAGGQLPQVFQGARGEAAQAQRARSRRRPDAPPARERRGVHAPGEQVLDLCGAGRPRRPSPAPTACRAAAKFRIVRSLSGIA